MVKSIRHNFDWLDPRDRNQIEWLASYMKKQANRVGRLKRENESLSDYAYDLIDSWSKNKNPKKTNIFARKIKNAWASKVRESKNCTIAFPIEFKESLDELASKNDMSRSATLAKLIDEELGNLDKIKRISESNRISEINRKLSNKISDLEVQLEKKDKEIEKLQWELSRTKRDNIDQEKEVTNERQATIIQELEKLNPAFVIDKNKPHNMHTNSNPFEHILNFTNKKNKNIL